MDWHREESMENTGSVVDNLKFEEGKQNLTEAQEQAVLDEVMREIHGEEKKEEGSKDGWVNPADEELKAQEEAQAKEQADQNAAAKAKEQADKKAKAEAEEKDRLEKEKQAQESQEQTKARQAKEKEEADKKAADELAKSKQGSEFKIADTDRAKAIEALALQESLTLKEAEEQIVKDEAIVNKYKQNPIEMARALRLLQRDADKAKAELEATRKAAGKPPAPVMNNVKDYVQSQLDPIKDKLIVLYKKEYPEITDGLDDEKVYGMIKKDAIERTSKTLEENESKIVSAGKEKRAELIMGLAEQDKAFLPDIKAALDRTNPRQLLDKSFDINELIYWAKGRQMDRLVKEAEERGYLRGQEQSQIIGQKVSGAGNKQQSGSGAKKSSGGRLSDEQKERALDMFDGAEGMSEEDKFTAYIETYPEQFQN
jgi:hypothetical protein